MTESQRLTVEASKHAPGGVHSSDRLAERERFFVRASGSRIHDADGKQYIDYSLGGGAAILGHAPAAVVDAVRTSLGDGQVYDAQHPAEAELARELCRVIPCADKVRFGLTHADAIQLAIRVARAHTGRSQILKFEGHVHGSSDNVDVSVGPEIADAGPENVPFAVPGSAGQDPYAYNETYVAPWNDVDALKGYLERYADQTAAIICEPIASHAGVIEPEPAFLKALRKAGGRRGPLLVFDEAVTGFRVALGGAQQRLGVTPDMAVFAGAAGGGFPISVLAGRSDVMENLADGSVTGSDPFNSNVVSVVAALATLRELARPGVYESIHARGRRLMDGLSDLGLHVQGLGSMFVATFAQGPIRNYRDYARADRERQVAFLRRLAAHGVHVTERGTWLLSSAHTDDDVDATLAAAQASI